MTDAEAAELSEIVVKCARHVLPGCGIPISEGGQIVDEPPDAKQLVAFMGFTGDVLRGTMAIVSPIELMRRAYPLDFKQGARWEYEVFDWAGEVANRLLGRIKVALAQRSVDIEASTPRVMLAEHLHVTRSTRGTVCSAAFPSGDATIRVWFDAIAAEGRAVFGPAPLNHPSSPPEGDVLLF